MARFNERQTEQIRQERTEQILKAALKVFSESGIDGTKMSMIAQEAGISHGLMYHYFKSKDEVLHSSLQWAMAGSKELLDQIAASAGTPIDKITEFAYIALSQGNQDVFRIVQRFIRYPQLDEMTKQLIEQQGELYIGMLTPIVIAGQKAGQIVDEDPVKLSVHFLSVLSAIMADDLEWFHSDMDWNIAILMRMIKA